MSKTLLLGAIIGDIIGVPFECKPFRIKHKNFKLLSKYSHPSDDSVLTCAIMEWLMGADLVTSMQKWCRKYPKAGYGGKFRKWIDNPVPYESFGNGSAMRVSPIGWFANSEEQCLELATQSAMVSHNHPDGIKGAQAVALAVYMASIDHTKEEIKERMIQYYPELATMTLDSVRPKYGFDSTCNGSVPQALCCFFEGENYEDTIRNAVSLGGDSDTMAAIAGGVAEAFYGIKPSLIQEAMDYIPEDMKEIITKFSDLILE